MTGPAPRIGLDDTFHRALYQLQKVSDHRRGAAAPRHKIEDGLRLRRALETTVHHPIHMKMSQRCRDERNAEPARNQADRRRDARRRLADARIKARRMAGRGRRFNEARPGRAVDNERLPSKAFKWKRRTA